MRSFIKGSQENAIASLIDPLEYYHAFKKQADKTISRSHVLICCDPDDVNHLYGYLIHERLGDDTALHFAFVKKVYRRMGVFKAMMEKVPSQSVTLTCFTYKTGMLMDKYRWKYNPFLSQDTK